LCNNHQRYKVTKVFSRRERGARRVEIFWHGSPLATHPSEIALDFTGQADSTDGKENHEEHEEE
jgi:hypothetical protein